MFKRLRDWFFDIFNSGKIYELRVENRELKRENVSLKHDLELFNKKFEIVDSHMKSTPDECVPGNWCTVCGFYKEFHFRHRESCVSRTVKVCSKGMSCPHFVSEWEESNDNRG